MNEWLDKLNTWTGEFLSWLVGIEGLRPDTIKRFRIFISSLFIFYLVLNLVRTERDIRFVLNALIISFFFVTMVAVTEIWLPGYAHYFSILRVKTFQMETVQGIRVGSITHRLFATACGCPVLIRLEYMQA